MTHNVIPFSDSPAGTCDSASRHRSHCSDRTASHLTSTRLHLQSLRQRDTEDPTPNRVFARRARCECARTSGARSAPLTRASPPRRLFDNTSTSLPSPDTMIENTRRRLLYTLNSRWVYGKVVRRRLPHSDTRIPQLRCEPSGELVELERFAADGCF